jgi:selenocysteine lyase/cysteine desulfurase
MDITALRHLFPALEQSIYFDTATMALGSTLARDAYARAVDDWSRGRFKWVMAEEAGEQARAGFAGIVGAQKQDVAIVPTVSIAAGTVAANMPPAKRGENILVGAREFSSNYYPWLLLRERGYDVRTVGGSGAVLSPDLFAALADDGTRLIAVSAVQSSNGYRSDLRAIGRIAARSGAHLYVDASQAAGAVPINVINDGIDFLGCASYKFMLGSRGMSYLYVRPGLLEQMRPLAAGWKAARQPLESFYGPAMELSTTASRLDGSLVWFAALADAASLTIFTQFGLKALLDRNAALIARLHDALRARNEALTLFKPESRSTIVSLPVAKPDDTIRRLADANVVASVRAGRLRLGLHFYNTEDEIDRVVDLLYGA